MADEPKFLLGRGETLQRDSRYRGGPNDSKPPYEWHDQAPRINRMLADQTAYFDSLPDDACPDDNVVSKITLHPQYYSRSQFPTDLLREADLRLVGSMPAQVKPAEGRGSKSESGIPSTVLFVAGRRSAFRQLTKVAKTTAELSALANDLLKVEKVGPMTAADRIKGHIGPKKELLEVVLHHDAELDLGWEEDFFDFAKSKGVQLKTNQNYQSRGLLFLPAIANEEAVKKLASYSFVRAIRPMPKLRPLKKPSVMRTQVAKPLVILPSEPAIDTSFRVAVFDGGLPGDHPFEQWVTAIEPPGKANIGAPVDEYVKHGMAVTSALLFGSVHPGLQPRPYCGVDHFRVLGNETSDHQLYPVMLYIDQILGQSTYEFATLSIGPVEIVGDDVTAWTTMLDDHFQQGQVLGTIAVGNDGEEAWPGNRIQVPSDCVNALAVGASDSNEEGWARASYSCIGPGRAPGVVKPDLVQFGGTAAGKFKFVYPGPHIAEACGTSFATPAVMRIATALRAHFGNDISTLGIRTLLVHNADPAKNPREEVGWGLANDDLSALTICPDGSVRVMYQGHLDPSKVVRLEVPLPQGDLDGNVEIKATFCYLCQTDPHTPGDYTRAGLGITFRPHQEKFPKPQPGKRIDPDFPVSKPFFESVGKKNEQDLRRDAFKWDTTRHAARSLRGSSLNRPVFDIHYQAREPGSAVSPSGAQKLPYALVVTVTARKHPDLYDKVLTAYPTLAAIRPRTRLPVVVRT